MTLRISDHAVLRYLERAGGFEIERLRLAIADRVAAAAAAGAGSVTFDGLIWIIRHDEAGAVVTTAMPANEQRGRAHGPRRGKGAARPARK